MHVIGKDSGMNIKRVRCSVKGNKGIYEFEFEFASSCLELRLQTTAQLDVVHNMHSHVGAGWRGKLLGEEIDLGRIQEFFESEGRDADFGKWGVFFFLKILCKNANNRTNASQRVQSLGSTESDCFPSVPY